MQSVWHSVAWDFINFPFSLSFTVRRSIGKHKEISASPLAKVKHYKAVFPRRNLQKNYFLYGKFGKAALEAEILVHLRRADGAFTLCLIEPTHCSIAEDTAYGRKLINKCSKCPLSLLARRRLTAGGCFPSLPPLNSSENRSKRLLVPVLIHQGSSLCYINHLADALKSCEHCRKMYRLQSSILLPLLSRSHLCTYTWLNNRSLLCPPARYVDLSENCLTLLRPHTHTLKKNTLNGTGRPPVHRLIPCGRVEQIDRCWYPGGHWLDDSLLARTAAGSIGISGTLQIISSPSLLLLGLQKHVIMMQDMPCLPGSEKNIVYVVFVFENASETQRTCVKKNVHACGCKLWHKTAKLAPGNVLSLSYTTESEIEWLAWRCLQ